MNGLTNERYDALLQQLREYTAAQGEDLPKCDAAYRELYGDQIDLFTFRQAWRAVRIEQQQATAEQAAAGSEAEAGDADLSQDKTAAQTPAEDPADDQDAAGSEQESGEDPPPES